MHYALCKVLGLDHRLATWQVKEEKDIRSVSGGLSMVDAASRVRLWYLIGTHVTSQTQIVFDADLRSLFDL